MSDNLLTAEGDDVFRIGTSTRGLTIEGDDVFDLPALEMSSSFNPAWNAAANTVIQSGASTA